MLPEINIRICSLAISESLNHVFPLCLTIATPTIGAAAQKSLLCTVGLQINVQKLSVINIKVSYLNTFHQHIILVYTAFCILPNTSQTCGTGHPSHSSSTRVGSIRSHSIYTRGYSGNTR